MSSPTKLEYFYKTNEVLQSSEDPDDYDAFNDETFGGDIEDNDDWEKQHEILAGIDMHECDTKNSFMNSMIISKPDPLPNDTFHNGGFFNTIIADNKFQNCSFDSTITPVNQSNYIKGNAIKRPIRAEDLEEMLLREPKSSTSNNSNSSQFCTSPNSQDSGWSPFNTHGFMTTINMVNKIHDNSTEENKRPKNILDKFTNLKPIKENSIPLASESKLKICMTVDELEKHLLSSNNESATEKDYIKDLRTPLKETLISPNKLSYSPRPKMPPVNSFTSNMLAYTLNPNYQRFPFPLLPNIPNKPNFYLPVGRMPVNRLPFVPFHHQQPNHLLQLKNSLVPRKMDQYHCRSYTKNDNYSGLMTQKDKEWLIKIQANQLHFDDPYKEDYYFVTYNSRKLTASKSKEGKDGESVPFLIIPERPKNTNDGKSKGNDYKPLEFEGSLGKIQIANIHNPRKLLDLGDKQASIDDQERILTASGRADLNNFRKLLLNIEKLYMVVLSIEEEDKKMGALPKEAKKSHIERKKTLCLKLFNGIYDEKNDHINHSIAKIRKGCALIFRALTVLNDPQHKSKIIGGIFQDDSVHYITSQIHKSKYRLDFIQILADAMRTLDDDDFERHRKRLEVVLGIV